MKMHEQYDPQTFENDIAILTLDRNVIFSKSVQAACLPDSDFDYTGTRGTVTGWGTIYFGGPSSNILQEVTIYKIHTLEDIICLSFMDFIKTKKDLEV